MNERGRNHGRGKTIKEGLTGSGSFWAKVPDSQNIQRQKRDTAETVGCQRA
jgi:hypothetical protein